LVRWEGERLGRYASEQGRKNSEHW
jgi:hypothetical protein